MGLRTVVTANSQISTWWYATTSSTSHWAQLTQTGLSRCVKVTTDGSREATNNDPHTWIKLKWRPCSNDPILCWVSFQVMHMLFVTGLTEKAFHFTILLSFFFLSQNAFSFSRLAANSRLCVQVVSSVGSVSVSANTDLDGRYTGHRHKRKWKWASKAVV